MFDWLVYVMAFLLVFDITANAPYTGEREVKLPNKALASNNT